MAYSSVVVVLMFTLAAGSIIAQAPATSLTKSQVASLLKAVETLSVASRLFVNAPIHTSPTHSPKSSSNALPAVAEPLQGNPTPRPYTPRRR
ncbi:unnamed protein product [Camellia sinensis]